MVWRNTATHTTAIIISAFMAGTMMASCSSTPEPQPEPSKQEIRQDSDRFFNKMGQEEGKKSTSP